MTDAVERLVALRPRAPRRGLAVGTGRIATFCRAAALLAPDGPVLGRARDARRAAARTSRSTTGSSARSSASAATPSEPRRRRAQARRPSASRTATSRTSSRSSRLASAIELLREKSFARCTPEELAELADADGAHPARRRRRAARAGASPRATGRPTCGARSAARSAPAASRSSAPARDGAGAGAATARAPARRLRLDGRLLARAARVRPRGAAQPTAAGRRSASARGSRASRARSRRADPDEALRAAAAEVVDWDGGTRIGESLKRFLDEHGHGDRPRRASSSSARTGSRSATRRCSRAQMARLSRLAHRVVWLNPLKEDPAYEPLARGHARRAAARRRLRERPQPREPRDARRGHRAGSSEPSSCPGRSALRLSSSACGASGCRRRSAGADEDAPRLEGDERADVVHRRRRLHGPLDGAAAQGARAGARRRRRRGGTSAAAAPAAATAASCSAGGRSSRSSSTSSAPRRRFGSAAPRRRAVEEIGAFCTANGIDAHFRHDGWLWAATSAGADRRLGRDRRGDRAATAASVFVRLEPEEVARRGRARRPTSPACWSRAAATVQPALLARGLRRVALERGVRILEHSPMTGSSAAPPGSHTSGGVVTADRLVLAHERVARQARASCAGSLFVIASDIVATAADAGAARRDRLDGRRRDLRLAAARPLLPDDARRSHRVRPGRRGHRARRQHRRDFDGAAPPDRGRGGRDAASASSTRLLADVPHRVRWTGPIDRSHDGLPLFGRLGGRPDIVFGAGYSGNGVGPVLARRPDARLARPRARRRMGPLALCC